MRIDNNFKDINFKANLVCNYSSGFEKTCLAMSEIAKATTGTEGDIITFNKKFRPFGEPMRLFETIRFDYFKKDNIFPNGASSIEVELKDDKFVTQTGKALNNEEYQNKIIDMFKNFVDRMSKAK